MKELFYCVVCTLLLFSTSVAQEAKQKTEQNAKANVKPSEIYAADSSWTSMLSEDLDGWEVFTGIPHKSTKIEGFPQSTSEDCREGTPFGLGDPLKIFTVEKVDDDMVLNVSGEGYAGLTTKDE